MRNPSNKIPLVRFQKKAPETLAHVTSVSWLLIILACPLDHIKLGLIFYSVLSNIICLLSYSKHFRLPSNTLSSYELLNLNKIMQPNFWAYNKYKLDIILSSLLKCAFKVYNNQIHLQLIIVVIHLLDFHLFQIKIGNGNLCEYLELFVSILSKTPPLSRWQQYLEVDHFWAYYVHQQFLFPWRPVCIYLLTPVLKFDFMGPGHMSTKKIWTHKNFMHSSSHWKESLWSPPLVNEILIFFGSMLYLISVTSLTIIL